MTEEYTEALERQREQKAEHFATDDHSPLPEDQRGEEFPGLAYFDPDPAYRLELPLAEHDHADSITVETSTNGQRDYLRWGEFAFELAGETRTLQAYKQTPDDDRLWLPFRDDTNGEATYGAGRYLDLEYGHHQTDDGWIVDFNLAYNPTCAYNEAYECPLIPMENWLDVPIAAGEKAFPGGEH
jgi:uncharacterized protein (DUF1684 family)